MYDSIKPWINVPLVIKPFLKYSGSGAKQFDANVDAMCYPVGDNKLVTNEVGSEVTSTTQLYVDGTTTVKVTDNVIFNGEERPILRVANYYRNGVVDLRVVYL